MSQNNLANAYLGRIRGQRGLNIERAIDYYQQALTVYTPETFPERWAMTQNNLANAYSERIHGERALNIERAIDHYQQALTLYTPEAFPERWAMSQHNLANAYSKRIGGQRAENLERAIDHAKQALQIRTREASPEEWAATQNNLASAYSERIRGQKAENLERAIDHYQQALQIRTREAFPEEWAATQNNLASAYRERIRGERVLNIERAIDHGKQALAVYTQEAFPEEWAGIQNGLAVAYSKRVREERGENIERAIDHYQQALAVYTQENFPEEWAGIQNNLMATYRQRIRGQKAENLERAIFHWKQALVVYSPEKFPENWAMSQHNLATAYLERIRGERAENLEQVIHHLRQALQVSTREALPEKWGDIQNNLAIAYSQRIRGERGENLERAIDHAKQALQVRKLMATPYDHLSTQRNLGGLYFGKRQWADAHTAFAAGLTASDLLYQTSSTTEARQLELGAVSGLPNRAAYCLARLGRFTEAVSTLEQGKARTLAEALTRQEAVLEGASTDDQTAFMAARERIRSLEAEARAEREPWARDFLTVSADLRQARDDLSAVVARIREYLPEFMPEGLDFSGIASVANALNQPLVYLLTTSHGSLALIVPPNQTSVPDVTSSVEVVWLDTFQADELNNILYNNKEKIKRYLHGIVLADTTLLKAVLDDIWPRLADKLMRPIATRLALKCQQAVLIPSGTLNLLPLHTIVPQVNLTYAPSARALQTVINDDDHVDLPPALLGVGNPLANNQTPLAFARLEVAEIAPLFAQKYTFYEEKATREAVSTHVYGITHLHFSCHGTFDLLQPLNSALFLAGSDTLTLRDLLSSDFDVSAARLAVLSACQTGITDFQDVPDEAIGFPAGFLQAGVPGVISTLWPVDDISTSLLLSRFYGYHLVEGFGPAAALWKAQQWLQNVTAGELRDYFAALRRQPDNERPMTYQQASAAWRRFARQKREEKPFAHPFYWAAFTFTGV